MPNGEIEGRGPKKKIQKVEGGTEKRLEKAEINEQEIGEHLNYVHWEKEGEILELLKPSLGEEIYEKLKKAASARYKEAFAQLYERDKGSDKLRRMLDVPTKARDWASKKLEGIEGYNIYDLLNTAGLTEEERGKFNKEISEIRKTINEEQSRTTGWLREVEKSKLE